MPMKINAIFQMVKNKDVYNNFLGVDYMFFLNILLSNSL